MKSSTRIKVDAYIRQCAKMNCSKTAIRDGIRKGFNIEHPAITELFREPKIREMMKDLPEHDPIGVTLVEQVTGQVKAPEEVKVVPDPPQEVHIEDVKPVIAKHYTSPIYTFGSTTGYKSGYYRDLLGLTNDINANVDVIFTFYKKRMSSYEPDAKIKETLYEYISTFNARGLDGADIVADRISMVSRKAEGSKHSLNYLVGCLRNAMTYGLASTNPKVDNFVIDLLQQTTGTELSEEGRNLLLGLVSLYGIIEVMMILNNKTINAEKLILGGLESLLRQEDAKE